MKYLCVRGHVVLFSEHVASAEIAAKKLYGTADKVTAIEANKDVTELYAELRVLHYNRTGNLLLEKPSMMPQQSTTRCPCGSGQESWLEYSRFKHTILCRVCPICLPSKEEWIRVRRHL